MADKPATFQLVLPVEFDLKPLHSVALPHGHRADIFLGEPVAVTLGAAELPPKTYHVLIYCPDGQPTKDSVGPGFQDLSALGVKRFLEIWTANLLESPRLPTQGGEFMTLQDLISSLGRPARTAN